MEKTSKALSPQKVSSIKQAITDWRASISGRRKNLSPCPTDEEIEALHVRAGKADARAQFDFVAAFNGKVSCSMQEKESVVEDLFRKSAAISEEWIEKSAQGGYLPAQSQWANMLKMDKKFQESLIWSRKAAEQGDSNSQRDLATYYDEEYKKTVSSNEDIKVVEEMWFWHNLAEYRVYWTALDQCRAKEVLDSYKIEAIEKRLHAWKPSPTASTRQKFQEDAETADFDAQMMLARFSLYGDSPKRDFSEGYFWLLAAVKYMPEEAILYFKPIDYDGMKIRAEKNLTPEQITAVKERVKDWKPEL